MPRLFAVVTFATLLISGCDSVVVPQTSSMPIQAAIAAAPLTKPQASPTSVSASSIPTALPIAPTPPPATSTPAPSAAPATTELPTAMAPEQATDGIVEVAATASLPPINVATIAAPLTSTPTETLATPPTETPAPAEPQTAQLGPPVRIVIDALGMDQSILSVGLDENSVPIVPNHNVGWYNLSATPGQGDNVVLWGHVLRFINAPNIPAPFASLQKLGTGARVTLYDQAGNARSYIVTQKVWATPEQVSYILPQGRELLTMVSCIGSQVIVSGNVEMTHRLITIAEPAN